MKKIFLSVIYVMFSFCVFAQVESVSVEKFEKRLIATESRQLIDVRTPQEYETHRIPNAKNINFGSPEFRQQIEQLDKTKPVLIYCRSGVRSKAAMEIFREAGFQTVYELDGGIQAWINSGRSVLP